MEGDKYEDRVGGRMTKLNKIIYLGTSLYIMCFFLSCKADVRV
jgi:hypothetical protein